MADYNSGRTGAQIDAAVTSGTTSTGNIIAPGYGTFVGGVYVGADTDPGADNLVVDGISSLNGSVKGAEGVLYANSGNVTSGGVWDSGLMTVPANSIITDMGVVCTTLVAAGNGTYGTNFGASAGADASYSAAIVDNIKGTSTAVAVGVGVSSVATTTTSLGGAAILVLTAGTPYRAASTAVHGRVTASAGSITAGAFGFFVKYITIA